MSMCGLLSLQAKLAESGIELRPGRYLQPLAVRSDSGGAAGSSGVYEIRVGGDRDSDDSEELDSDSSRRAQRKDAVSCGVHGSGSLHDI